MTKRAHYPKIGSVSEGTLRTEDLLDTFASELSYHMKRMRLTRVQRKRFNQMLAHCRDYDTTEGLSARYENWDHMVDNLQDALDEIAAPYSYFGATGSDGACFGFWPRVDPRNINVGDSPIVIEQIEREHWGEDVLLVNDHGNVECGHVDKRGKFHEYWSCV